MAAVVAEMDASIKVVAHGVPDDFIDQAPRSKQLAQLGLDARNCAARERRVWNGEFAGHPPPRCLMRLGVIGHQGYDGLPEILRTLFRLAPALGIEAFLEQGLHDVAGKGARLEEPGQLDGLVTLGETELSCAARAFWTAVTSRFSE